MEHALPPVYVLVLNYNGERYLTQCLESLARLSYPNKQVVVLDSASTDGSFERAQKNFPQFHFLPLNVNRGFAYGINVGIRYALDKGAHFVWPFNPDATCSPDTLTLLVEAFLADQEKKFLSPIIYSQPEEVWFAGGEIDYLRMRAVHIRKPSFATSVYRTGYLTGCSPLIHKEVIQKVGFLDERFFLYYEDADYSLRVRQAGYAAWIVSSAGVWHAEQSVHNPQKAYHLVISGLIFFALHTPWYLRPYIGGYVALRRFWNKWNLYRKKPNALSLKQAYQDYFTQYQDGFQLYLRKLQ